MCIEELFFQGTSDLMQMFTLMDTHTYIQRICWITYCAHAT